MQARDHAVVVAGAGPTGMMLGAELALAGVDVVVLERRSTADLDGSRSGGLHARTIEVLDQRGVADRFLAEGTAMQVQSFAGITLHIEDFPTRHPYGLALWQRDFERILAGWVAELGVPVRRGVEITGVTQDPGGVRVDVADGPPIRAGYLVGCDGGRSLVRKAAGIEFAGWEPTVSSIIAEAELTAEPQWGIRRDANGQHGIGPIDGGARARVVISEPYRGQTGDPTLADLRRALTGVWGSDFGVRPPTWMSRFTDMTRQAVEYRRGRILLAGDAAHVHYPVGGQGLNVGVQDAVNLGWKLARVAHATSPAELLDSYHSERHPVAARVLHNTMAATSLLRGDDRIGALRDIMADLLDLDEPRRRIAAMISGLDIRYELGGGHPLTGRRMPDLDLSLTRPARVYELLRAGRPVLISFGAPPAPDLAPWTGTVSTVTAPCTGPWELPVVGLVDAPQAVLIRPDGHVAWAGESHDPELPRSLAHWFGGPVS